MNAHHSTTASHIRNTCTAAIEALCLSSCPVLLLCNLSHILMKYYRNE